VPKKVQVKRARKPLKLKRMGLPQRAADRMRTMIIRGELPPGSRTQETQLSKSLGVSRTPLREAMKVLAAEKLIELRPNRSPRIANLDVEGIPEEFAAERATDNDLQRLRSLQTRMEGFYRDGKLDDYFAINGEIHCTIVRMARNTPLQQAHDTLISRAERARYLALGADHRWSDSVDEHVGILAALEARDGEAAGRLLRLHVQRTGTALLEVFAGQRPGEPAASP
jgi:DNA-binding GntR family transcriptional regulator